MNYIETTIRSEPWQVISRLTELDLPINSLIAIRDVMQNEFLSEVPYHCKNKAGTFAYHEGVYALRSNCIGNGDWEYYFKSGLEGIISTSHDVVILISGVDRACQADGPQPRSSKGAESEKVSAQISLFDNMTESAPAPEQGRTTLWLMVDEFGNAELTRPAVKKGMYVAYVERNYIAFADDPENGSFDSLQEDNITDEFDPIIARK